MPQQSSPPEMTSEEGRGAKSTRVAVIGSGLPGLLVAFKLKRRGHKVTVFEELDATGGCCRTIETDGYLLEAGPQFLQSSCSVDALVIEVGLERDVCRCKRKVGCVAKDSKVHRIPQNPLEVLASSILGSTKSKCGDHVEPLRPLNSIAGLGFGKKFLLSGHIYQEATRSKTTGSQPFFRMGPPRPSNPAFLSFRRGMRTLPERLEEKVGEANILVSTQVDALERKENAASGRCEWEISYKSSKLFGGVGKSTFDAVVLALGLNRVKEIQFVEDGARTGLDWIPEERTRDVSLLVLGFAKPSAGGVWPHRAEGGRYNHLVVSRQNYASICRSFHTALFPGRGFGPKGASLVTVFLKHEKVRQMSEAEMLRGALREVKTYLGIGPAQGQTKPDLCHFVQWKDGLPIHSPSSLAKVCAAQDALEDMPGIFVMRSLAELAESGSPGSINSAVPHASTVASRVDAYAHQCSAQEERLRRAREKGNVVVLDDILQAQRKLRARTRERQKPQFDPLRPLSLADRAAKSARETPSSAQRRAQAQVESELNKEKALGRSERISALAEIRAEKLRAREKWRRRQQEDH